MSRRIWCKHYRAMFTHETCEAGVPYEKFKGQSFDNRPCFCKLGQTPPGGCDKAEYPTAEEIAAEDAAIEKRLADTMTARKAIVEHLGGPWKKGTKGASGHISCPVCKTGALRFSRAGYNGHIHAGCTTDGCVSWME